MIKSLILGLGNRFTILFVVAFLLTRIQVFRRLVVKKNISLKDKVILSVFFGCFGITGTYLSVGYGGALVNTRVIGVVAGGILGGPFVGLTAGLIAGIHRGMLGFWGIGAFTALACAVSTPIEGYLSGIMGKYVSGRKNLWIYAVTMGAVAETLRKFAVLIFARPFETAYELIMTIWIPMTVINCLGLALFFLIIQSVFSEHEKMLAEQSRLSLKIVDEILPYIRQGLDNSNIEEVASTIHSMSEFDAVTITDKKKILAHVGLSTKRHKAGNKIVTSLTTEVLDSGKVVTIDNCREPECEHRNCPIKAAIITPLIEDGHVIGTMKLYKALSNSITAIDQELGNGLAKLVSTQLTLGKLEQNKSLLARAELKALQSQINPHFLFNSLTVIGSLCRTNNEKARKLILKLSDVFRKTLNVSKELVTLSVELEHVKAYVEIEKARFGDKLDVKYDICLSGVLLLPPLTLQPLVENSIKHGLLPKDEGGLVEISLKEDEYGVMVSVVDNGAGMATETKDTLLRESVDDSDSVGFKNVNARLIATFGEASKLSVHSEIDFGTTVSFLVPKSEI
ncbi:MAG: LytS/YhcK type 5TM receptor domain-containing protein [Alkaliphilus sp.]